MSPEAYYNLAQCAAMRYVNHGRRPDDYRAWLMWLDLWARAGGS